MSILPRVSKVASDCSETDGHCTCYIGGHSDSTDHLGKQQDNANSAENLCPNDWLHKKGKCYKFFMNFKSWIDSQKLCSLKKSHLLVIEDKAELEFIQSNIQVGNHFWIGLNITHPQKAWTWLDGTPLNLQLFQVTGQIKENVCALITNNGVFSESCLMESFWICQEVISSSIENKLN
ncbi:killer cell lectin-like receptor subfamily F member 1 isoform X3 [Sciurus carolinensis]|uniref:killer cell lectin-like receptor subfamily F member 1 isoform X3 n=1 Tax=Sciurus carolinensis TaxID=30640 RepID=UPI001FB26A45|nr:killer cell lectin-like receptor subfamily F member 1 isoform X3 [Sciurus carolinensis]